MPPPLANVFQFCRFFLFSYSAAVVPFWLQFVQNEFCFKIIKVSNVFRFYSATYLDLRAVIKLSSFTLTRQSVYSLANIDFFCFCFYRALDLWKFSPIYVKWSLNFVPSLIIIVHVKTNVYVLVDKCVSISSISLPLLRSLWSLHLYEMIIKFRFIVNYLFVLMCIYWQTCSNPIDFFVLVLYELCELYVLRGLNFNLYKIAVKFCFIVN